MPLPDFIEKLKIIHWAKALLDTNGTPFGIDHTEGRIKTTATDSSGSTVNPATEDKQDDVITELSEFTFTPQGHVKATQDTQTIALNRYIANFHGHTSTLSAPASIGDKAISIQAADYAGFVATDRLFLLDGFTTENDLVIITAKPGSPVLTLNRALDNAYGIGTVVQHAEIDMASTVGSLAVPISYKLAPPPGITYNVRGGILTMVMGGAGDYSKFGDLAALTNGSVARISLNGVITTLASFQTNADFEDDASEPLVFHDKAGGGKYGLLVTYILDKFGTYVPLNGTTGDFFEILIQDDVTGLESSRFKFHGYITIN